MTNIMQKITPCLWFDNQAEAAAEFYTSIFDNSKIGEISRYGEAGQEVHGRPVGSVMIVAFELEGHTFTALNGGPLFKFTPAISFIINCTTKDEVDTLWEKLSDGGKALMPLDSYPFSERYGWVQDKYGVSWQLIYANKLTGDPRPKIIPSLMFVGENAGHAEEAMNFYISVFKDGKIGDNINRYPAGMDPEVEGTIMFADFMLAGQWLATMDSANEHNFPLNEAISFEVSCETQEEVDEYWGKLTAVPESEQSGWLKDKYGVSWQITPTALPELLNDPDPEKSGRVMEAMLKMKKIDIEALRQARASKEK